MELTLVTQVRVEFTLITLVVVTISFTGYVHTALISLILKRLEPDA